MVFNVRDQIKNEFLGLIWASENQWFFIVLCSSVVTEAFSKVSQRQKKECELESH